MTRQGSLRYQRQPLFRETSIVALNPRAGAVPLYSIQGIEESHPLSHFSMSSSHNTYLAGNQLSSDVSTDSYKKICA